MLAVILLTSETAFEIPQVCSHDEEVLLQLPRDQALQLGASSSSFLEAIYKNLSPKFSAYPQYSISFEQGNDGTGLRMSRYENNAKCEKVAVKVKKKMRAEEPKTNSRNRGWGKRLQARRRQRQKLEVELGTEVFNQSSLTLHFRI